MGARGPSVALLSLISPRGYILHTLSIRVFPSCIMIMLVSSDDVLFEVDREIAERSSVIRQMLEGICNQLSLQ